MGKCLRSTQYAYRILFLNTMVSPAVYVYIPARERPVSTGHRDWTSRSASLASHTSAVRLFIFISALAYFIALGMISDGIFTTISSGGFLAAISTITSNLRH